MSEKGFADLTDVTLADKDTNSILTDNANRAFQGNVAMKVTQPVGQLWNQCKKCNHDDNTDVSELQAKASYNLF